MRSIQEGVIEDEGRVFITKSPELLREAYMYLHLQGIIFYSGTVIPKLVDEYLAKGDNGFRLVRYARGVRVVRVSRDPSYIEGYIEITEEKLNLKRGEKI